MEEIWKDVVGFEKYYQISNQGNVRSLDRKLPDRRLGIRNVKGILLKNTTIKDGYVKCCIGKNTVEHNKCIHRLIAEAFIPNPENKPFINHKNGIRNDNRIENLEWCTSSENAKHGYSHNGRISPVKKAVKCIETNEIFNSQAEAAKKFNIHFNCVSAICRGISKHTLNGLTFAYINK